MKTWDQILEEGRGFMPARVVLTAVELDLFSRLGSESLTAGELARRLGTDPRATELLLNALTAEEILQKQGGLYSNSPVAAEFLDSASPGYRGGTLRHSVHLCESWSALTDVVRTGKPAERERTEESGRDFILAMYHGGWESARIVAQKLDPAKTSKMLDLGGGPGSYAIAFCKSNPAMVATVYDMQFALQVAKEVIASHGLTERIELVAGDFLTDPVPGGYDLVLVSHILHSYGEEDCRLILRAATGALVPGGRLVVQDFMMQPDRIHPPSGALFAINMLVNTPEGRTYTVEEIKSWMEEFAIEEIREIEIAGRSTVLVGTRT